MHAIFTDIQYCADCQSLIYTPIRAYTASTSGTAHSAQHAAQGAADRLQAACMQQGIERPPEAAQRLYKPLQDVVRKMGTGTSEAQ